MTSAISFLSLNARGLRDKRKRATVYLWLSQQKADIFLLQETYFTADIECDLELDWNGVQFHDFGSTHSRGVSILIRKGLDVDVVDVLKGNDGRKLIVVLKDHCILNVYAPNDRTERGKFFSDLCDWVTDNQVTNLIAGGDFNDLNDNGLDRQSKHATKTPTGGNSLNNLKQNLLLVDIWRKNHPQSKQFTWTRKNPYPVSTRIDFWLIQKSLVDHVLQCTIKPSIKSDHKAIFLKIRLNKEKRGPGLWRLNTAYLSDQDYMDGVKNSILDVNLEYKNTTISKQLLWELIKKRIKEFSIGFCKQKAIQMKGNLIYLEKRLLELDQKIDENLDETTLNEYTTVKTEIEKIYQSKARGAQIRARAEWTEKGEKSLSYFLNLEKWQAANNNITKLSDGDTDVTDQGKILQLEKSFYERLYTSDCSVSDREIDMFLETVELESSLSEHKKLILEKPLEKEEYFEALQAMKTNRSPGTDGLPAEFYLTFWNSIGDFVFDALKESMEKGCMSPSQKRAVLKLIFKKGDRKDLANWRPISLLNTDYKLLAAALAKRLQAALPNLISHDQTAYLKNRFIGQNVRVIHDVIYYCNHYNIPGAIICLDFQKAFDMVNWNFMLKTLQKFGFGPNFISLVKMMYTDIECCLTNFGWKTAFFKLQRGIRQGCPLSALLFNLVVEILALKIRHTDLIKGIKVKVHDLEYEVKISQVADDTTLTLSDDLSIQTALNIVDKFSKVAGPRLNLKKCEALWIGSFQHRRDKPFGITWPGTPIKSLGLYFSLSEELCETLNWDKRINKIENMFRRWQKRKLTLYGKCYVIKTLALSQIIYNMFMIPTPEWVLKKTQKLTFSFLWDNKPDKIKRTALYSSYTDGGIKMTDIYSKCKSLQASWVKRLLQTNQDNIRRWQVIPLHFIEKLGKYCNIFRCNFNVKRNAPPLTQLPPFYREVVLAWQELGGGRRDLAKINDDRIWSNKNFKIKVCKEDYMIWINFCKIPVVKLSSKYLYSLCLAKTLTKPSSQAYWDSIFPNLNWTNIWRSQTLKLKENKLKEFNFKLLHKILPCRFLLHKWKIVDTSGTIYSPKCAICNQDENYSHMFFECVRLRGYWDEVKHLLSQSGINIAINTTASVLFGGNFYVTLAKYAIFVSWTRYKDNKELLRNHNVLYLFTALTQDVQTCKIIE